MIAYFGGFVAMFRLVVTLMAETINDYYGHRKSEKHSKLYQLENGYG